MSWLWLYVVRLNMQNKELTEKEKTEVEERTINTLEMVCKSSGFDWRKLDKKVIAGLIGMYIEGIKYAKEIFGD